MAKKKAVGLELSSRYLRGVEIEGIGSKTPVVTRAYEMPLDAGIVKDGEVLDVDLMAAALDRLWGLAKFTTKDVVTGIGNQRVLVRNKVVPAIILPNIRKMLAFQVKEDLPVDVEDAVLDYYPLSHDEQRGEVDGFLVAAVKSIIDTNIRALAKAKLNPVKIDLLPFALIRALIPLKDVSKDSVSVILNLGSRSTSFSVVAGNIPSFIRFIGSGSDNVVDAIMKLTNLDYEKATRLQNKLGVGAELEDPASRRVAEVINEQVNTIFRAVRESLKFYQNNHPESRPQRLILVGSGARIPGLAESLSRAFGMQVEFGAALINVTLDKSLTKEDTALPDDLSVPVGLALGA
jgi:type IV pilus assembly protein PilM